MIQDPIDPVAIADRIEADAGNVLRRDAVPSNWTPEHHRMVAAAHEAGLDPPANVRPSHLVTVTAVEGPDGEPVSVKTSTRAVVTNCPVEARHDPYHDPVDCPGPGCPFHYPDNEESDRDG